MDKRKLEIQRKLIASVVLDKCLQNEYLICRDAWCTKERILRFTTPFFRKLFSVKEDGSGKWKTGDFVMYEINNGLDTFEVHCVMGRDTVPYEKQAISSALMTAAGICAPGNTDDTILKTWDLTRNDRNVNQLLEEFEQLIVKDIPCFEQELREALEESAEQELFKEGATSYTTLNQYERSAQAREACLAAHGTVCAVCGIDFSKVYGPEFAGMIEVHHIVPLSEIGEEYTVDPVKDLVPVCPNCHSALHSKNDGVYTVEELKAMRVRQQGQHKE